MVKSLGGSRMDMRRPVTKAGAHYRASVLLDASSIGSAATKLNAINEPHAAIEICIASTACSQE